jgi:DNA-directed RNA polymerase subunit beta'
LKENVIVGRLIPAGTGLAYHRMRRRQQEQAELMGTTEPVVESPFAEESGSEQVA